VEGNKYFEAAQGYIELGMPSEALTELDLMPQTEQLQADILNLRAAALMHLKRWAEAERLLQALCQLVPSVGEFYIHAAFCLHELGRTEEARAHLLSASNYLQRDPIFHYNLGCYETCLGHLEKAREHLRTCFALDKTYLDMALTDADLAQQRDWLRLMR
jgi:Flp pilus assembly protein TadD